MKVKVNTLSPFLIVYPHMRPLLLRAFTNHSCLDQNMLSPCYHLMRVQLSLGLLRRNRFVLVHLVHQNTFPLGRPIWQNTFLLGHLILQNTFSPVRLVR